MTFFRRLWFGCWWRHNYVLELSKGKAVHVCQDCRITKAILPKQKLKLKKENVIHFRGKVQKRA